MTRGISKVADLKANSIVDPQTGCWHWQLGKSGGYPRIRTFDHALGDKRSMNGPRAVWNIAHGEDPGRAMVYRSCMCADCVNPVHHARGFTQAEISAHIARTNILKGKTTAARMANLHLAWAVNGVRVTPPEVVRAIRASSESITVLAARYGICKQTVGKMRAGQSHKHLLEAA